MFTKECGKLNIFRNKKIFKTQMLLCVKCKNNKSCIKDHEKTKKKGINGNTKQMRCIVGSRIFLNTKPQYHNY